MTEPLSPTQGWGVLHLFCKITPAADSGALTSAIKRASEGEHQVVTAALLGHKADFAVMAVGPDLWRLHTLQADLQAEAPTREVAVVLLADGRKVSERRLELTVPKFIPPVLGELDPSDSMSSSQSGRTMSQTRPAGPEMCLVSGPSA